MASKPIQPPFAAVVEHDDAPLPLALISTLVDQAKVSSSAAALMKTVLGCFSGPWGGPSY